MGMYWIEEINEMFLFVMLLLMYLERRFGVNKE